MTQPFRLLRVAIALAFACAAPAPKQLSDSDKQDLEQRIRDRKVATANNDSVAWLQAASLHPAATCADASGALRRCRPDYAKPSQWEQRTHLDSIRITTVDSVAIVTYRQIDSVLVGTGVTSNSFRYVETYLRRADRWELLSLAEAGIPPVRTPVQIDPGTLPLYVGTYGSGTYALVITRSGDALTIAEAGEKPDTLMALSPRVFFARGDAGLYEFAQSGVRPATELTYRSSGQPLRFPRVRP